MSPPRDHWLTRGLRAVVLLLAGVAAASLLVMLGVTVLDVVLRVCFNAPIKGTIDIISITGALTIACALPYTSAIKGHVAVEYFFLKLGPRGRVVVDAVNRLLMMGFFGLLGWQLLRYGHQLLSTGQVSQTLQWPVFWVPCVMAFCCGVMMGVKVYHLFHPGQALLRP